MTTKIICAISFFLLILSIIITEYLKSRPKKGKYTNLYSYVDVKEPIIGFNYIGVIYTVTKKGTDIVYTTRSLKNREDAEELVTTILKQMKIENGIQDT